MKIPKLSLIAVLVLMLLNTSFVLNKPLAQVEYDYQEGDYINKDLCHDHIGWQENRALLRLKNPNNHSIYIKYSIKGTKNLRGSKTGALTLHAKQCTYRVLHVQNKEDYDIGWVEVSAE